ncbi:hypothetical protein KUH03_35325 [Sphingobacterium sp. E70]|uniref:hypothetical protein n=1 Tax=Sphingobacterium sp. E70 TaxID=2853439 RepID=UPI00211C9EE4|nr:hypothetical protein [Sphingobacterium sp. E70]ULT24248.1 hypothetical protein KUH03_35325 [Sphingobacterium sp. E70]
MNIAAGQIESFLDDNWELIGWIRDKYERKAEVISLCTGAYFWPKVDCWMGCQQLRIGTP